MDLAINLYFNICYVGLAGNQVQVMELLWARDDCEFTLQETKGLIKHTSHFVVTVFISLIKYIFECQAYNMCKSIVFKLIKSFALLVQA